MVKGEDGFYFDPTDPEQKSGGDPFTQGEPLQRLERFMPTLLGQTQIDGVILNDLLKNATCMDNRPSKKAPIQIISFISDETCKFRRIEFRYLASAIYEGQPGPTPDIVQLSLHTETQPHSGNRNDRGVYFRWEETREAFLDDLYAHFLNTGTAFGVDRHGKLTEEPYPPNVIATLPEVNAISSLHKNEEGQKLLNITYTNFLPISESSNLVVPTIIRSPGTYLRSR